MTANLLACILPWQATVFTVVYILGKIKYLYSSVVQIDANIWFCTVQIWSFSYHTQISTAGYRFFVVAQLLFTQRYQRID